MKLTLKKKLSLSYISLAMICVLLISITINLLLENQFKNYVIKKQKKRNIEIVSLINQQYKNGLWIKNAIEDIGINSLEQGLIIKVKDLSGKIIWDATIYNSGMCERMLYHMSKNMFSRYPKWKGKYIENNYPIISNSKNVGILQIGYYGPFYFTDNDLLFINTLNRFIVIIGVLSLIAALIFGRLMARRISNPILRVINTADMISEGIYYERSLEDSDIKEINKLTRSINNLAENLQNQDILRRRLTQDVSHELRTPLATLQSHMEAMIDGIWEADTERLKSCHEEIMRISRMVKELENLAKFESENLILNKSKFDVSEIIKSILMNFEKDCIEKGIYIEFNAKTQLIYADKDKLSQVIINIISNAVKYIKDGGKINITVEKLSEGVEISIEDNGIGISKQDLPYIFERFYRADKSRNRLTGGAGIGLTITKSIVEAHSGKITVESEMEKGTRFTVWIPKQG